ncbi:Uncharacterised protein [Serratia ficaria]|nr:Uncharacterised protein [Serratia ficaria]CAI1225677.1 Uncharacterised protein [Serratia ficaria]CAI2107735.1 Uncharacterised protein [Serratia ficaria]
MSLFFAGDNHPILIRHADKDSDCCPTQPWLFIASRRKRFIGDLQQQTLMGIHHSRLSFGDAEELIIEAFHFPHKGAPARVTAPDGIRIRIVNFVDVKAGGRDIADTVRAGQQHLPEVFRRIDVARQPTSTADNGNRLFRSLSHGRRRHRRLRRFPVVISGSDLRHQRLGHLRDARVVEREHTAQRHPQRLAERLRQDHRP